MDDEVERIPLELPIVHGYIMPLPTSDRCIHGVQLGAHRAGNYQACDICFHLVQRHRDRSAPSASGGSNG